MSETITIDKDVPQPTARNGHHGQSKYPFAEMKVGDSFAGIGTATAVRSAFVYWTRRHDKSRKFSVHATATGCRCWRVA